jgi:hypothetical protein
MKLFLVAWAILAILCVRAHAATCVDANMIVATEKSALWLFEEIKSGLSAGVDNKLMIGYLDDEILSKYRERIEKQRMEGLTGNAPFYYCRGASGEPIQ